LRTIGERLKQIRLNRTNEAIQWNSRDEIGELVAEYNRMVKDLEESAVLLAKTERESAWKEMARQVAHEIKNPLTPMRLMIQHLDHTLKTEEKEKLHEHTQAMIDQIDAMTSIADAFSRFAEMPEYKLELINLNEIVSRSINLYPSLNIVTDLPDEEVYAMIDRDLWVRVLNNLIKNAWQSVPEGREPKIVVGLKRIQNSKNVLIWVSDNGIGIPENQKNKIFEPSFTTKSTGMGMGLAIVKTIVNGLKGKIWLESEVGAGSTFFIELEAS
jgi:nitrogen fixation/metabolism regulation signal transduction histidine kinase